MGSIPGKAMQGYSSRVTRVDACGRVVYGEASQAVSEGFVSVAWTANTTEVAEIAQENARGRRCLYKPAETKFASYSVVMTFCEVDPEYFGLVTGQRVILDAFGNAVGFAISSAVDLGERGFGLEVWAGSPPSEEGCTNPNAQGRFGYFLAAFMKGGILGDYTIENGAINFTITGATTQDGTAWGVGPYPVQLDALGNPGPLIQPLQNKDHKVMIWTEVAPPAPFYGTRPLLDPSSTSITAVVATEGGSPMEASFEFTGGAADAPVWIEFGDGTWDWIADGTTDAVHVYEEEGTFQVRASSDGKTWRTTSVVIHFP